MPPLLQSQKDSAQLFSLGIHVQKAAATLPATTTQNIFTIGGGRVWVVALVGEVTTVIQNQANNLKVTSVPTTGITSPSSKSVTYTKA